MKMLLFLLRFSKTTTAFAILAGVSSGLASASLVALINRELAGTGPATTASIVTFFAVTALVLVLNYSSRVLLLNLSTQAILEMRLHLCRQILSTSFQRLEGLGSNRLLAALTEDVLTITTTLADFPLFCVNLAIFICCLGYLLWLSPLLALALIAFVALGTLTHEAIERRARTYLVSTRETWDVLIGGYQTLIHGSKELRLHRQRREFFFSGVLQPTALTMRKLAFTCQSIFALANSYGQALYFVLIGLILFAAPGFGRFDPQVLTGFTLIVIYMNAPLSYLVGTFPSFRRATIALEKLESLGLSLTPTIREDKAIPATVNGRTLELKKLRYTYRSEQEDHDFTLGPIDLQCKAGEITFLIGGNGSGKSSLVKLITGLYAPDTGEVRLDGRPIDDENRDDYRQHFSVVFSDFYLFESLVGLHNPDLDAQALHYLQKLQLASKVQIKDGVFSTTNLSQGQRKRLALLTAYLEDRPIYVFDEWAADQDPYFKEIFYLQLLPELKARGKMVLVISHDDLYYDVADKIIKLDSGKIIEQKYPAACERT